MSEYRATSSRNARATSSESANPVAALERDLSDLLARRDVVEQKFDQAHAALAAATNERRQALLDSDLDDATAAARRDGVVRDARDAIEAIGDALSEIGTKIVNAQSRLVAARDCVEREQVVRQATAEVEALTSVPESFREVSARLTAAIAPLATRISSAADFLSRTQLLLSDIATVSAALAEEGRSFAARTEAGSEPLHRPAPPAPMPEPAPVLLEIERERVYCLAPFPGGKALRSGARRATASLNYPQRWSNRLLP
jgi:predicted  nucleic acid-binding Zn-ribbon protein